MSHYDDEIAKAVVLALFVPLIISSGGNSGSLGSSLIIRALARLRDWWRVFGREILPASCWARCSARSALCASRFGSAWGGPVTATITCASLATVWRSLIGVVGFGPLSGSMLPFILRRLGFDPATSSAFVATLVDVTALIIYFSVAAVELRGFAA